MTCEKCGKELLIGSTLCPDCDVFETPQKPKRKLSKRGKLIIWMFVAVLLLSGAVWAGVFISGFEVSPVENGNGANMACAEKIGKYFYYSDGDELFGIDERFKKSELIDNGQDIFCLKEINGQLYYVKNKVLCRYSPDKRVKSELLKLPVEKEISVLGNNKKKIYFSIDGSVYVYEIVTSQITFLYKGNAVINHNHIYLANNGKLEKISLSDGEKEVFCEIGEFEKPIFTRNNDIFVVDYEKMKLYTINRKNGKRKEILNSADYGRVSDVSKVNYYSGHLYLTGEDGIYKINIKNKKDTFLGETGYVNSISVAGNKIFSRRYEGATYFSNMSGKVLYKEEFDAE